MRLIGSGFTPRSRHFIVLEYLQHGPLSEALKSHEQYKPFPAMNARARELADALEYLHSKVAPDISIIHRDIKPDNIGISGVNFKLIDFGLSISVKKRSHPNEAYLMTGCTGSLRYMAPEVARREAYNEKVDVHSFGILLWQLATCSTPFPDHTRETFMKEVIHDGRRPKLYPNWPQWFTDLLQQCWHPISNRRPSFHTVFRVLEANEDF